MVVCVGMPACGQAVGCGVCDMPELWRGAAGLCARVRACAGAAKSLDTYIHSCMLHPLRHFVTQGLLPSVAVLGCDVSVARVWLCEDL